MRTYNISKRGREVATIMVKQGLYNESELDSVAQTLSRMARLCPAYTRIQERWCSEEMSEKLTKKVEEREAKLENTLRKLVTFLPKTRDGQTPHVVFSGDPRGFCVKVAVENSPRTGNTWGFDGRFGL